MRLFTALLFSATASLQAGWRAESPGAASPTVVTEGDAPAPPVSRQIRGVRNDAGRRLALQLVLFDRSRAALKVVDLAPDETVASALQDAGALAGVNGSFFHADRTPLGLVIRGGIEHHPLEKHSNLLTGVLAVTARGAALLRTEEYRGGPQIREALQAGPFLVDKGATVPGLNAKRPAERTILLADKKGVAALLITPPITLAEAGELLATPGLFRELRVERALNLDGGSSTALWVNARPTPYSHSEWKPVRNALAIVPRAVQPPTPAKPSASPKQ